MFNVVMSSSRLAKQFHQPTIVMVSRVLFHDLPLSPGDQRNSIDDGYVSQLFFPDCW